MPKTIRKSQRTVDEVDVWAKKVKDMALRRLMYEFFLLLDKREYGLPVTIVNTINTDHRRKLLILMPLIRKKSGAA